MILSVDPGVMTGWAAWSPGQLALPTVGQSEQAPFARMVHSWWESRWIKTIVCERYTITQETLRKSRQPASLELIGFLRGLTDVDPTIDFVLQSPADAKRFASDEKLAAAGWLQPKKDDHANDSLRHLMLYMVKNRLMEVPRATVE
jgi:hypothetical protein